MSELLTSREAGRANGPLPTEPMDPQVRSIQPGGGIVMQIELWWGTVRRWALRTIAPGYVEKMRQGREGEQGGCPFDPIDARDTKYYQNQQTYRWPAAHDRYAWRDRLPFVRAGLAELVLLTGLWLLIAIGLGWLWWPLAIGPLVVAGLIVWFFRNPHRVIPTDAGMVVSPADGKVVVIEPIDDPLLGKAILIGIFLSIFNVHANRSVVAGRVLGLTYRKGKFLNALRPESAKENEQLELRVQETVAPFRVFRIRQITGQFARRIVCWVSPGALLRRGEMFGMIKLGSRTELVLPAEDGLKILVKIGDKVSAGSSPMASYQECPDATEKA
jgi:phosphatidylserine decarboxylase